MAEVTDSSVPSKRHNEDDNQDNIRKKTYNHENEKDSGDESSKHSEIKNDNESKEEEKPFDLVEYLKCSEDDEEGSDSPETSDDEIDSDSDSNSQSD